MASLFINRFSFTDEQTLSRVVLIEDDGTTSFSGVAVEDTVREKGVKIKGKTAIQAGSYSMRLSQSPRFGRILPELLNVPNFEGIRIHRGNSAKDSEGCIIIGSYFGSVLPVQGSTVAERKLIEAINNRQMKIHISGGK